MRKWLPGDLDNNCLLGDDRWRELGDNLRLRGERRDHWGSSSEKSGSYGVERTEESVRKNKGGPWRMVGDGALVVYRQLIINPGRWSIRMTPWQPGDSSHSPRSPGLGQRRRGRGPLLISSGLRHLKSSNLETFHQHPSPTQRLVTIQFCVHFSISIPSSQGGLHPPLSSVSVTCLFIQVAVDIVPDTLS